MNFGTRLKILRKEKNISQEELAKLIGVSRSSVGNYETNQNMPTAEILDNIANILDCSLDYLLCKTDLRNPEEDTQIKDIYMHLAKEAQDLELDKEDVDYIINFYKKNKK